MESSSTSERETELTREQTLPALRATLSVVGADEALPQAATDALRWLLLVWAEGHDHVPLFLIHDLGFLLLRGRELRFSSSKNVGTWTEEERGPRLSYEDRLLARWAVDPSVIEAHVAVAGMNPQLRDTAIAHAISIALAGRLLNVGLPRGNPAHVRSLIESNEARAAFASNAALRSRVDDAWRAYALEQMAHCQKALSSPRLFTDADLWDIAHLPDVPSESARRALREVHRAKDFVGPASPGALLDLKRAREVPLDDKHADIYPTGGFDAISTKGSFENLVRSEVAYVGAGVDDTGGRPVDLFDVRFAENELLYYTRDESPLLEARRVVTLVIDRAAELRHKITELPAQTLVLALGVCLRVQTDLVNGLGPLGSFVTLILCGDDDESAVIREELGLLSLSLRSEIAHRRATLGMAPDPTAVDGRRIVVLSPRPRPQDTKGMHGSILGWFRIGGRIWVDESPVRERDRLSLDVNTREIDPADPAQLRRMTDKILELA
jgi:hypothetical protein